MHYAFISAFIQVATAVTCHLTAVTYITPFIILHFYAAVLRSVLIDN